MRDLLSSAREQQIPRQEHGARDDNIRNDWEPIVVGLTTSAPNGSR